MSDMDMNQNGTFNSTTFTKTKLFSGKILLKCICFKRLVNEHLGSGKTVSTDEH